MTRNERRAAVLGRPIAHSLSPVLHSSAYAALGLAGWTYTRHDVGEEELAAFVAECGPAWAGLSLTMPLKQVALQIADVVEPLAEAVGAANTLLLAPGGLKVAANTDVYGLAQALRDARDGLEVPPRTGVIIGGGATAASAIAALGEFAITRPVVLVRSLGRAGTVIRAATTMGVDPEYLRLDTPQARAALAGADVVISTVPGGASASLAELLGEEIGPHQTLLDVVYEGWPTPIAAAWARLGGRLAPGYDMLLYQAAEQVRLMTGRQAPVEPMREALRRALEAS